MSREPQIVAELEDEPVVWYAASASPWAVRRRCASEWRTGAGWVIASWRIRITLEHLRRASTADCPAAVHAVDDPQRLDSRSHDCRCGEIGMTASKGKAVTIREHVREALLDARPHGLTMTAIAGVVKGPWRDNDVHDAVRRLWEVNELGRTPDGAFYVLEKATGTERAERPLTTRAGRPTAALVRTLNRARWRRGRATRRRARRDHRRSALRPDG